MLAAAKIAELVRPWVAGAVSNAYVSEWFETEIAGDLWTMTGRRFVAQGTAASPAV